MHKDVEAHALAALGKTDNGTCRWILNQGVTGGCELSSRTGRMLSGLAAFKARARPASCTLAELPEVVSYRHNGGVCIFLTWNVVICEQKPQDATHTGRAITAACDHANIAHGQGTGATRSPNCTHLRIHGPTRMSITSGTAAHTHCLRLHLRLHLHTVGLPSPPASAHALYCNHCCLLNSLPLTHPLVQPPSRTTSLSDAADGTRYLSCHRAWQLCVAPGLPLPKLPWLHWPQNLSLISRKPVVGVSEGARNQRWLCMFLPHACCASMGQCWKRTRPLRPR